MSAAGAHDHMLHHGPSRPLRPQAHLLPVLQAVGRRLRRAHMQVPGRRDHPPGQIRRPPAVCQPASRGSLQIPGQPDGQAQPHLPGVGQGKLHLGFLPHRAHHPQGHASFRGFQRHLLLGGKLPRLLQHPQGGQLMPRAEEALQVRPAQVAVAAGGGHGNPVFPNPRQLRQHRPLHGGPETRIAHLSCSFLSQVSPDPPVYFFAASASAFFRKISFRLSV